MMKIVALSLVLAACGAAAPPHAAAPAPTPAAQKGLQIKLTSIYVDDQDKALHFYTDVMGFAKKDDVSNNGYRWLTVTAAGDPDGGELQLASSTDPTGKAYQQALYQQHRPAAMLFTDDVKADSAQLKARGATFTMEPTDIGFAIIAMVDDGNGNLIQLTQLER